MKKVVIIVGAVVVAAVIAFALVTVTSPKYKLQVQTDTLEATQTIDFSRIVTVKEKYKDEYSLEVQGEPMQSFGQTGKVVIPYVLSGNGKTYHVDMKFKVVDTTPPEINLVNSFVQIGESVDMRDLIKVTDSVDGKIDARSASVEGEIDYNKNGTYPITVTISDASGNEATQSFDVVVADKEGFVKQIEGLWLNHANSKEEGYTAGHYTGLTDVSMTQFDVHGGEVYITTFGDIQGLYDSDPVTELTGSQVQFTYISPDYTRAKGLVGKYKIEFDLSKINKGLFTYTCNGLSSQCAHTGFKTLQEMDSYLWKQSGL